MSMETKSKPREPTVQAYRRRSRIARRAAWPAVLAVETLADFLDCLRPDGKIDDRALGRWRSLPGFLAPDQAVGMWYRADVEEWLEERRRRDDPVVRSRTCLDERFGNS